MLESSRRKLRWTGPLLALLLLGSLWLHDHPVLLWRAAPWAERVLDRIEPDAPGEVGQANTPGWFAIDPGGCLIPHRVGGTPARLEIERPRSSQWQATGSGDRLREDPCGHVWGLWFNSWTVHIDGQPGRMGHVGLPTSDSPVGRLARSGVQDFLPLRGELWLLGRQSELVRYAEGRWQDLKPPQCMQGRFAEFDGDVWLGCRAGHLGGIYRWDELTQDWDLMIPTPEPVDQLHLSSDGRLIAAFAGKLSWMFSAERRHWVHVADLAPRPTGIAADDARIAVADELGLSVYDWQGSLLLERRPLPGIRGIVLRPEGLWLAVWNRGLFFHDGSDWQDWTYAEGLPDDSARDLMLDRQGRLWLGGTPGTVIDADAASQQIGSLSTPPALEGRLYDDACAAAQAELADRPSSGRVAQARLDDLHLVFFAGEQICPDPWQPRSGDALHARRDADGALLRVPHNGHRSSMRCNGGCEASQRAAMQARWSVSLLRPTSGALATRYEREDLTVPDPLPVETALPRVALPDDGSVWIATRTSGIWRHARGQWERYGSDHGFSPANRVEDLAADRLGRIWVTSRPDSYALERVDSMPLHLWEGGMWRHHDHQPGKSSVVLGRLAEGPHSMFIGSNGDLIEADGLRAVVKAVPLQRGWFGGMVVDDAGYRWAALEGSTPHRGLAIADSGRLGRLDTRQGLFADRLRRIALDHRGDIWVLAEDGRVAVYARQLLFQKAVHQ